MKRFVFVLSLLLFVGASVLQGQGVQVTGNVTGVDDGAALPGVSVVVRGTTIGAVTDFEGNYSITVPDASATLMFSFVGMLTQEVPLDGRTSVDVVLESTSTELDEVVVTALGVSREKKSLGYSVQEVDGDAVSGSAQSNFASSLSGKVSGVQIKAPNTMGGSSNVLIRGSTSITGNNQPLYVIDGVPVDNSNYATGGDGWGGYDYGNVAQDLNPNDIESISVLKGAAASALYGSRAANGVILVTTKKGKTRQGIGVSVSSNFMVGKIDKSTLPQQQFEYGGGYGPFYEDATGNFFFGDVNGDGQNQLIVPTSEDASWGEKFDPSLMVVHWDALDPAASNYGEERPWAPPAEENRMPSFFETSTQWVNTVAFDGGNKDGRFRLSYTNYDEKGILPNSELSKNTVNFSGSYNFGKKLTVNANVTYTGQKALGRMGTGYDGGNVMQSFGQWFQTNVDFSRLEEYESPTGLHRTWNYTYWEPDYLYPIYFDNLVELEAEERAVDPLLVYSVIRQESLFQTQASSWASARGLMQVIPDTGEWIAMRIGWQDFAAEDLYLPYISVKFGTFYLQQQLTAFDGDVVSALTAYNAGPGNALRIRSAATQDDPDLIYALVDLAETRLYLEKVLRNYAIYHLTY